MYRVTGGTRSQSSEHSLLTFHFLYLPTKNKKIEGQKEKDKKRKGERKKLKGRKWKRMKSTKR